MTFSIILAAVAVQPAAIVFRERLVPTTATVRLGEVAVLDGLPPELRLPASGLVISAAKGTPQSWAHRALAARARALMPALGPWLSGPYGGTLRVIQALDARKPIIAVAGKPIVVAGDKLTARISAGIFKIEREATALQPAEEGAFVFVRTSDGVLKALCCGEGQ